LELLEGLTDIDSASAMINGIDVRSNPYKVKQIIGVLPKLTNILTTFQFLSY